MTLRKNDPRDTNGWLAKCILDIVTAEDDRAFGGRGGLEGGCLSGLLRGLRAHGAKQMEAHAAASSLTSRQGLGTMLVPALARGSEFAAMLQPGLAA